MFLSGSCSARIALSGRPQKTSRNPTLVAQQSISYFVVVMLSRVVLDLSIFYFINMTVGCVLCKCAQTYLILLVMVVKIIMNDKKDDNDDLM